MPTTAAVIEHPKFGVVLWDTGINDAVADPARADDYWGKGLPAAFGTHNFTRQHTVDKQLEKLGYKPADVRYVVYSHLHLDHAGGMSTFRMRSTSSSGMKSVTRYGRISGLNPSIVRMTLLTFAS